MAFVKVASLPDVPPGSVTEVTLGGEPYAICNSGGNLYALTGTCPHAGGPLAHGNFKDPILVCPWHEWAFDCRTGENDFDPEIKLDRFAIKTEGGNILMDPETRA